MSLMCRMRIVGLAILATVLGLVDLAIPVEDKDQQLIRSAASGDLPSARELLAQGASVQGRDRRGRTALLRAVEENHIEMAQLLIEAGADVNVQDSIQDSPLLLAGASGRLEILKLMLDAHPDFSILNRYGGTALIPACERGHVDVVKLLLTTDVDLNHVNHLGWTALMEAIVLSDGGPRHQAIVQLLVDAGADVTIPDHDGVTPLQHATRKGFTRIIQILHAATRVE